MWIHLFRSLWKIVPALKTRNSIYSIIERWFYIFNRFYICIPPAPQKKAISWLLIVRVLFLYICGSTYILLFFVGLVFDASGNLKKCEEYIRQASSLAKLVSIIVMHLFVYCLNKVMVLQMQNKPQCSRPTFQDLMKKLKKVEYWQKHEFKTNNFLLWIKMYYSG